MKTVGLFPYGASGNPYTRMISNCANLAGFEVRKLQDTKYFPIRRACREPIDLLHLLWPGNFYKSSTKLGTMAKKIMFYDGLRCMRSMPVIYSADNLYPHDSSDAGYEIAMTQKILNSVRGVIVASRKAGDLIRETYQLSSAVQVFTVPHRTYEGEYANVISRQEARAKLQIENHRKVILSLGRINPYKGLDKLIPSFLSLNEPNAVLLIAGSAKNQQIKDDLMSLINKHRHSQSGEVRVVPSFIPDDEIQIYYKASDVVALSYSDVPMNPGSVILSMSFGLPVICVSSGSVPEILGDQAYFGYDSEDAAGLSLALGRALSVDNLVERGLMALERVRKNHSEEVVAKALEKAYTGILNR